MYRVNHAGDGGRVFRGGVESVEGRGTVIGRFGCEAGGMKKVWNGQGNPENCDVEFPDEIVMDPRLNRKLEEYGG